MLFAVLAASDPEAARLFARMVESGSTVVAALPPDQQSLVQAEIARINAQIETVQREIDRILAETVTDPVGPEFMAPPVREEAVVLERDSVSGPDRSTRGKGALT